MTQTRSAYRTDWRSELRQFQALCEASEPAEQADRLREALRVFHPIRHADSAGRLLICKDDLDALLSAGAFESAALGMLSEDVGFMVSRGRAGLSFASVILPGSLDESSAAADTVALAILAATASALLMIDALAT